MQPNQQTKAPYRETKRLKADQRRVVIQGAAQSILLQHGFSALTMRNAAEAAGIRMATLQYYYPSRAELFEAAFQSVVDGAWAEVMSGLEDIGDGKPEQRLRRFIAAMCASCQNEALASLFVELWAAARIHDYAADIMSAYYGEAVGFLAELIRSAKPRLSKQKSNKHATMAMAMIEGQILFVQMGRRAARSSCNTPADLEAVITVMLDAV